MTRMLEAHASATIICSLLATDAVVTNCFKRCSFAQPKALGLISASRLSSRQWRPKFLIRRHLAFSVRAVDTEETGSSDDWVICDKAIAPLNPESPTGQFLMQTLKENPHLFLSAADHQLEQLAAERDASHEQPIPSGIDATLYRRIAKLKSDERRRAVEEVIYALVVQRFVKNGIKMVPQVSVLVKKNDGGDEWRVQEKELEYVHSPEALEMIKEHMEMVLGGQETLSRVKPDTVAEISKLRVGQIYATSVMYGYFLKRVDERFQLEKKMNILKTTVSEDSVQIVRIEKKYVDESVVADDVVTSAAVATKKKKGSNSLRAYVSSFDHETLSKYATMRTHETVDLIERHAEAVFGRPELRVGGDGNLRLAKDDGVCIEFMKLRGLVLEAAAFGSYLWQVESHVDTLYPVVVAHLL